MQENFRIKIALKKSYMGIGEFVGSIMQSWYMIPTEQSISDVIIKGFESKGNIYLDVQQNVESNNLKEVLIDNLKNTFDSADLQFEYDKTPATFFDEFICSYSFLENIDNGVEKLLDIIHEVNELITEEEQKLEEYRTMKNAYDIVVSKNYKRLDLYDLLNSISDFRYKLDDESEADFMFWYKFHRIHTDKYSAQEHFKEIVKPIHLILNPLGFRKKAFKFILHDKENDIEKVIWLQKGRPAQKDELTFVVNYAVRPAGSDGMYERSGHLFKPSGDRWFTVNISIDTEETIKVLEMHINKILEIIMDFTSAEAYRDYVNEKMERSIEDNKRKYPHLYG